MSGGKLIAGLGLLTSLWPGGMAGQPAPAPEVTGSFAPEVVTLPPYKLDAVEPPWARDTRTASPALILPAAEAGASLVDQLRGQPGVHIDQPGGPGGRSSIFLRGGEENYAVVLLDGAPINNPTDSRGGGFDFGTLDASEFAAVEVVPGPVSARYGPDALSGVIKLTSDVLGADTSPVVALAAGDHRNATAYARTGGREGAFAAAASVHWSEAGSREEGNFAWHQGAAVGATWQGSSLEARLSLRYGRHDGAAFPDDSGGPRFATLRSLEERSGSMTTAAVELLSPGTRLGGIKWRLRSWGAWLHDHDDSPGVAPGVRDPAGLPASLEATSLRRAGVAAEAAVDTGSAGTLAAGVDGESERGVSDARLIYGPLAFPASFAATRDRVGAFAEYTWRPAAGWLVQPSGRVDQAQAYSSRFTPRLGVKVPVGERTALRFNAGTGFKRPSFYAISNPLVGNPALRPEKARTLNLGIERQLGDGRGAIEAGAFSSRYRDGIDFDPGPPPRLVNRNEIRSDGMELVLHLKLVETVEVAAAGSYADVRTEPGGQRLRGRPKAEGSVRFDWKPVNRLVVRASLVSVGGVLDSSVPTGDVVLPGWRRLDLTARYEVRRGLVLTAAAENILDAHYEEAIGVPSPGMRWRAGVEARF